MRKIILICSLFIGCASTTQRDTKTLEAGLDQTQQMCDERIARARQDLTETKARLTQLNSSRTPNFKQNQAEIDRRVQDMEQTLVKTKAPRAKMTTAKSEIASLVYNRSALTTDDPNSAKVDEQTRVFYAASDSIQKTVSDYSMKSSDLDEFLHNEKLYHTFHPAEFQTQVRARIETAQEELRTMQSELDAARTKSGEGRQPSSAALDEMQNYATKFIDKANRLSDLAKEMTFATADAKQISNLDAGWEKAQKLRTDFANLQGELDKLSLGFSAAKAKL